MKVLQSFGTKYSLLLNNVLNRSYCCAKLCIKYPIATVIDNVVLFLAS